MALIFFLLLAAAYYFWSSAGRSARTEASELHLEELIEYGADSGRGNLLGIQPFMTARDYASEQSFFAKLDGYMKAADEKGWLNSKTVAVLPEYIGTWLVAAGEKQSVYEASSVSSAMQTLALSNLFSFVARMPFAEAKDRTTFSLFKMKSRLMAEIYNKVFSQLARKYRVTIVAGSIALPSPEVKDGKLEAGDGPLYNISAVYRPDGSAYETIARKAFPIDEESPFIASGEARDLPVFDTPAGRLGVLICADSWYPAPYETLRAKKADLIAVPSFIAQDGSWAAPWRGYNGAPEPDDVDLRDIDAITEGEAWIKYAMAARSANAGISRGINVFLRGRLWDMGSDGRAIITRDRDVTQAKQATGAAIINSWL